MSNSLYAISSKYEFLQKDLVNEETGEVNEDTLQELNELSESFSEKGVNIVKVIKNFEAESEMLDREIKRLEVRKKSLFDKANTLREYLHYNMEKCGIKKISCVYFNIVLKDNPESVEIYDKSLIDERYHRVKIDFDKTKIRDDIKNGFIVDGAKLIRKKSLSIT